MYSIISSCTECVYNNHHNNNIVHGRSCIEFVVYTDNMVDSLIIVQI